MIMDIIDVGIYNHPVYKKDKKLRKKLKKAQKLLGDCYQAIGEKSTWRFSRPWIQINVQIQHFGSPWEMDQFFSKCKNYCRHLINFNLASLAPLAVKAFFYLR